MNKGEFESMLERLQKMIGVGALVFLFTGMEQDKDGACTRSSEGVCSPEPHLCKHDFRSRITYERSERIPVLVSKKLQMDYCAARKDFLHAARIAHEINEYGVAMNYYEQGCFFVQAGEIAELLGLKQKAIEYYKTAEGCEGVVEELALDVARDSVERRVYDVAIKHYELAGDFGKNQVHYLDAARIARKTKDFVAALRNYKKSGTISLVRDDLKKEAETELSVLIEEGLFSRAEELATAFEKHALVHVLSVVADEAEKYLHIEKIKY